uniref:Queuosine 5'-phosphate N-glycosylase/hydrolase n=1 Tax=Fibrocapsa japonica TaxID=94617 RepID=A0A7S2UWC3_9STRA|mmetsp:Transcript_14279/g.20998  ORF Transcript_14279/g.20998 Transcript_14279/m.20998 type:complete len:376 (+) Transcript_14279:43-1170(+)
MVFIIYNGSRNWQHAINTLALGSLVAGSLGILYIKYASAYVSPREVGKQRVKSCQIELDPLKLIKKSAERTVARAQHVQIVKDQLEALAREISDRKEKTYVEWDECGWHYNLDISRSGILTCQYIFVLDSLNFCFWPTKGLEYEHLAIALKNVLIGDPAAFNASNLVNIKESELQKWLPGVDIPLIHARVTALRQLGAVLLNSYDGLAIKMVEESNNSASKLVQMVVSSIPSFRDESVYNGEQVFFYKRAQILAADIWGAFGRQSKGHICGFSDMEEVTMFADYRVPQILEHRGVLKYSQRLCQMIVSEEEIPAGSDMEIEIRAATIQAVEMLQHILEKNDVKLTSVEIDWLLWQEGEKLKENIQKHHKTRTMFY